MELTAYLAILGRRKWVVAATAVATLLVAAAAAETIPPTYAASTTLRVATFSSPSADLVTYDTIMYAGRLLNTYSKIALSEVVLSELGTRLGVMDVPRLKVDVPANSELMLILAEGADPDITAAAANTLADILMVRVRQLSLDVGRGTETALAEQLSQVELELQHARTEVLNPDPEARPEAVLAATRSLQLAEERHVRLLDEHRRISAANAARANSITVIEPAIPPEWPTGPRKRLIMAMGLLIGTVGGIGLAFLLERLDTRLRTPEGIGDVAGLPVIGEVPSSKRPARTALSGTTAIFHSSSPARDAFRRLGAHLLTAAAGDSQTVAITSAEPGEGKSTVVANLAAAIAEQGRRVVVVDADLRAPTQHILLGVSNESGLSLVLAAKASWDEVTRDTSVPGLAVIPSGPVTAEAFELIAPHRMASLLAELRRWFDFIVVDTPSLLAVADAVTLAPIVDEVVLVAACGRVRAETARAARHQLLRAGATSVSVIANRVAASPSFDYYQARRAA